MSTLVKTDRKTILLITLLIIGSVYGVNLLSSFIFAPPAGDKAKVLKPQPAKDSVYILGNSMFVAGVDLQEMQAALPGVKVQSMLRKGEYSSLWYLMIKNAILKSKDKPGLLVWGFRTNKAEYPAFRNQKRGYIEKFILPQDKQTSSVYSKLAISKRPQDSSAMSDLGNGLQSQLFLLDSRDTFREWLNKGIQDVSVQMVSYISDKDFKKQMRRLFKQKQLSVSDVMLKMLSKNKYERMEELVDDRSKSFIKGERVPFAKSFIPLTTELLSKNNIRQLVVIFKTRPERQEGTTQFADDASNYFKQNGIDFINLEWHPEYKMKHYAKGDHLNKDGRKMFTKLLSDKVASMLAK